MKYYLAARKKNDILKFTGKWIEISKITLSAVSKNQKKYSMYSLISR